MGIDLKILGPQGPQGPIGLTGGVQILRTLANQIITNAVAGTYINITNLSFSVSAGIDYAFKFYIVFRVAQTTTGFKFAVNGPAGTIDYFMTYQTVANGPTGVATWLHAHQTSFDASTLNTATITANVDLVCIIEGRFLCTSAGVFSARAANEVAANIDLVIQKGSYGNYF